MAFKLSKSEEKQRQDFIETLRTKQEELQAKQEEFQNETDPEAKEKARQQITVILAEILVAIEETETFRDEIATRLRDEYDEKSEKWQESDKASEVDSMISDWENASFEEPELENPETMELEDYAGMLEELPDSVD